jgi:hypothetical protein
MLAVWGVLRLAEARGELFIVRSLRKARAEAARALCSSPDEAKLALRRAGMRVVQAYALAPTAALVAPLLRAYAMLRKAAR